MSQKGIIYHLWKYHAWWPGGGVISGQEPGAYIKFNEEHDRLHLDDYDHHHRLTIKNRDYQSAPGYDLIKDYGEREYKEHIHGESP
jgi:hypothetical protein